MEKTNQDILKDAALEITYIFNAPQELVWEYWTDADRMREWWGPKGYTIPFCKIDFRVGGEVLYCMRSPEGKEFWGKGVYQEIIPYEKFIVTDSFADENGNTVSGSYYGMPEELPIELLISLTFDDLDNKTKMTLKHHGIPSGEISEMTEQSWNESFDKLQVILEKCKE